jgi:hypothetical protein
MFSCGWLPHKLIHRPTAWALAWPQLLRIYGNLGIAFTSGDINPPSTSALKSSDICSLLVILLLGL